MIKEHYLIKKAVLLPDDLCIRSKKDIDYSRLSYITKTMAAPGDDDDYQGLKEVWYSWESQFS